MNKIFAMNVLLARIVAWYLSGSLSILAAVGVSVDDLIASILVAVTATPVCCSNVRNGWCLKPLMAVSYNVVGKVYLAFCCHTVLTNAVSFVVVALIPMDEPTGIKRNW